MAIYTGDNNNNVIAGSAGNDTLHGNGGDDALIGGTGDDRLYGDNGADTYIIAGGDGRDTIYDINDGSVNVVQFTDVVSTYFAAVNAVRRSGGDLVLRGYGTKGLLTLSYYFDGYKAEQFQFSDGVTWTWSATSNIGCCKQRMAQIILLAMMVK